MYLLTNKTNERKILFYWFDFKFCELYFIKADFFQE